jgi:hypothetical protein
MRFGLSPVTTDRKLVPGLVYLEITGGDVQPMWPAQCAGWIIQDNTPVPGRSHRYEAHEVPKASGASSIRAVVLALPFRDSPRPRSGRRCGGRSGLNEYRGKQAPLLTRAHRLTYRLRAARSPLRSLPGLALSRAIAPHPYSPGKCCAMRRRRGGGRSGGRGTKPPRLPCNVVDAEVAPSLIGLSHWSESGPWWMLSRRPRSSERQAAHRERMCEPNSKRPLI